MPRNHAPAPDFILPDQDGTPRSLAELRGDRPLLLLFYRGAFCPTARKDLLAYANVHSRIRAIGGELAAVSADDPATSRALREKLELPFALLSDAGFAVSERYGVYRSDEEEGPQPHGEPAVFIVDVDGRIAFSQIQTGPKGAANPSEMALVLFYMAQHGGRY